MKSPDRVWRERAWLWAPVLIFFVVNLIGFGIYRLGYANRVGALEERLAADRSDLAKLVDREREVAAGVERARASRAGIRQLYQDRFSTRKRRLTQIIAEVQELAKKAGLDPKELSYPEERIDDFGLVRRSFNFSVGGTYAALRRFFDLLETSQSFVTIEGVDLVAADDATGSELRIDVKLSTLFALDENNPFAAPARPGAAPAAAATRGEKTPADRALAGPTKARAAGGDE
ncbi:MAG TPA: type 4a pilus biogenesis protein PilO [Thermoanaerobaculia bacterium]|jgi:Tfp pilus assembly protein PilO|nr:type 4a pilus biogenesis protein PilO [Thermoanaerobaculia bacterium]